MRAGPRPRRSQFLFRGGAPQNFFFSPPDAFSGREGQTRKHPQSKRENPAPRCPSSLRLAARMFHAWSGLRQGEAGRGNGTGVKPAAVSAGREIGERYRGRLRRHSVPSIGEPSFHSARHRPRTSGPRSFDVVDPADWAGCQTAFVALSAYPPQVRMGLGGACNCQGIPRSCFQQARRASLPFVGDRLPRPSVSTMVGPPPPWGKSPSHNHPRPQRCGKMGQALPPPM